MDLFKYALLRRYTNDTLQIINTQEMTHIAL